MFLSEISLSKSRLKKDDTVGGILFLMFFLSRLVSIQLKNFNIFSFVLQEKCYFLTTIKEKPKRVLKNQKIQT